MPHQRSGFLIEDWYKQGECFIGWIENIDFAILDGVQSALRSRVLDCLMIFLTRLGDYGWFWLAAAAFFLIAHKTRETGRAMALAIALELVLCNLIMKPAFHRIRPYDINTGLALLIARPTDFSFPSGHAAISFAAAVSVFPSGKKLGAAALTLAALIGFSRVYLYVHYPSDVLAGAALGTLCAVAVGRAMSGLWKNREKKGENR